MPARGTLTLLSLSLVLAAGCLPASASASDASATRAYVKANYAFVRDSSAHVPASLKGLANALSTISAGCPHAAGGTPQNEQSEHLSNEVIGLLVLEADKPDLPAAKRFLQAVGSLHWSNPSLNRVLHRYINQLAALSKLQTPDVCADVRAWVASGHSTLPASTIAFDNAFLPNWAVAGYQPRGLARFESGETRSLARRTAPLEDKLQDVEAAQVTKWADCLNALELGP